MNAAAREALRDADGAQADRIFRAVCAHLRQEFVAPAASMVGYAEILGEDAERLGLDDLASDLRRIQSASLALRDLIDETLAKEAMPADAESFRRHLRHDLRTPLNAIKGYGEMLLEDAAETGALDLAPDLRRLLVAAEGMLEQIDPLVDFTRHAAEPGARDRYRPEASVVSHTFESLLADDRPHVGPIGRILVVDDNAANRDLLARRLNRDGHSVGLAGGGAEALRMLAEEAFDLVLLDLMMPDISGYEVLAELKAGERTREIPVIMISALDELDAIVRCVEAGAVDYLPKPFDPTLLRARVGSSLDNKLLRDRERQILEELRAEKAKNDALLHNILPHAIVERIKAGEALIADDFSDVTILFADICGFTPLAGSMAASDLVRLLSRIFSAFDRLAQSHGGEKIKTIGDAYMVAFGVPEPRPDHAIAAARLALAMRAAIAALDVETGVRLSLRIGLHSGPVVAGVIGAEKFAYDVWGNTVNIASRLESHGVPGRIHVSEEVVRRLGEGFAAEDRGPIALKGAGEMRTYFLVG